MQYEPTQEQIIDVLAGIGATQQGADWQGNANDRVILGHAPDGQPLFLVVVCTHPTRRNDRKDTTAAVWWYAGNGTKQCPSGAWTKRGPYTQVMTPVNEQARMLRAEGVA